MAMCNCCVRRVFNQNPLFGLMHRIPYGLLGNVKMLPDAGFLSQH